MSTPTYLLTGHPHQLNTELLEALLDDGATVWAMTASLPGGARALPHPRFRPVHGLGVSPGQVIWPEDYGEAKRERLARRIPMRRVGTPDDIARLVRFLALDAPYLNGEIIAVDGGLSARY